MFWVWRNAYFSERKRKAKWAYDLVKEGRHSEKFTLDLLEDLVHQAESSMTFEAIFIAEAHKHNKTSEVLGNYGSPSAFTEHLDKCSGCRTLWNARYEQNKEDYSDKCPY